MSPYEVGSLCEDCLNCGQQNRLKLFYINLEDQITKCESSRCMFPYLRRSTCNSVVDTSLNENILNLDDFIEENSKTLNSADTEESKPQMCELKSEEISFMFDLSSLFSHKPAKEENLTLPEPIQISSAFKNNPNTCVSIKSEENSCQNQVPPKARITRCLSNPKKSFKKPPKAKSKKCEPVLVVDPQNEKAMRPLDLIQYYMKNKAK